MQPGQILVNKDGEKRKILEVYGRIIFVSTIDDYNEAQEFDTTESFKKNGWSLLEEPWRPTHKQRYWFIDDAGNQHISNWDNDKTDNFRWSIGNVFPDEVGCGDYKQKLIERMGRKE